MFSSPLSSNRKNEMEEEERSLSAFPEGHIRNSYISDRRHNIQGYEVLFGIPNIIKKIIFVCG